MLILICAALIKCKLQNNQGQNGPVNNPKKN